MKVLRVLLFIVPVCCFIGCNESKPGGPNASKPQADKTIGDKIHDAGVGTGENTFKISLPTFETGLKQGESKLVKVGISRGKNFDQDVSLDFGKLPTGITATPDKPTIKKGDKDAEVTLAAGKDAPLGDYTV